MIIITGEFEALDYGYRNLKKYGNFKHPVYDLSKITTRVGLWYSVNDQLVNHKVSFYIIKVLYFQGNVIAFAGC